MDWNLAREEERAALKRIVALLLALADLAELACGRSTIVRGLVLWILRLAETLARDLVAGTPATVPFLQAGDSPADAMLLAGSFRDLARELARELDNQATLALAYNDDGIGRDDAAWSGAGRALAGVGSLIEALAFLAPVRNILRPADLLDTS